ncbi:MAG TPA: tetratricopeptide repeat-containing sensor histidine kinase [Acidimicrobiia bacterium]|nr:tetratricopeptide repeat-containing sensor histidine kinase [Acidimicrobiia bacterium]
MDSLADKRGQVDAARNDRERLAALIVLSAALYEFDSNEAVEVANEALVLAQANGDALNRAWALHNRGWAFSSLGRLDEALDDQLSARAQFELEGDMSGVANALMAIGDLYGDVGDNSTALEYLERARAPLKLVDDPLGTGLLTNLTGIALSREGRHSEALDLFEQVEATYRSLDDTLRTGTARINQGFELLVIAEDSHEPERGELIARARELAIGIVQKGKELGEDGRHTLAYGKSLMAQVHAAAGQRSDALLFSAKAEAAAAAGGLDQLSVGIALDRAGWLIEDGQLDEAGSVLDQIVATSEKLDMRRAVAKATELRADLLEALGDDAGALASHREFHRLDGALHTDETEKRARLSATRFQVERARREAELAQVRVSELEVLDNDKRDFLASVSHELRTPLAAVLGFATELTESWDGFEPAEARALVRLIATQAADISSIVDDLLTVTRLEAGTMSIFPTEVSLPQDLADTLESAGRNASRVIGWEGDLNVWADRTRLTQIMRNLITNAIRYGGEQVRVVVGVSGSTGVIEVRDSGGPIPESRVATMFDPFDHEDNGGHTPNSVGLGLAVARSLGRVMDGDLTYDYDGESVFRLVLPLP